MGSRGTGLVLGEILCHSNPGSITITSARGHNLSRTGILGQMVPSIYIKMAEAFSRLLQVGQPQHLLKQHQPLPTGLLRPALLLCPYGDFIAQALGQLRDLRL